MFSLASKLNPLSPTSTSDHRRTESVPDTPYAVTTEIWSPNAISADIASPAFPEAAAGRGSRRPPHQRSLTANTAYSSPPLITNFSKPTVYPQEPSLPAPVFDPITDLEFEPSPPSSPTTPSKDRWSFLSNLKASSSGRSSPTKSTFSGRESGRSSPTKSENRQSRLADWFQGESAPIRLGVLQSPSPSKELVNPLENTPSLLPEMLSRRPTISKTPPGNGTNGSSPFNLFTKTFSRTNNPPPIDVDDEFVMMDAKTVLMPESTQTFSPAAFKNLQQKAEGLLAKMQAAYKERVKEKQEAQMEADALREELEEAKARADNFKQQVNDLSGKNIELNETIASLVEEVAKEKQMRRQDAAERTLRIVHDNKDAARRRPRASNASISGSMVSDSGFESNDENDDIHSIMSPGSTSPSSIMEGEEFKHPYPTPTSRCINCQARNTTQPSWALVGDLRTENARYGQSNQEVVGELDKCLEIVEDAILGLRR